MMEYYITLDHPVTEYEYKVHAVRTERDRLLADCDWTQFTDAPVDHESWAAYRQALRDVPDQTGFPDRIEWPLKPDKIVSDRLAEIATLVAYLSSTDWYAVRKAETDKAVPEDVVLARQAARDRISELRLGSSESAV